MENSEHYERNVKVIDALKEAGANMAAPHSIEHHIYSYSKSDFESISKAGEEHGYLVENSGQYEDENGVFWSQDLTKRVAPVIENIEQQSKEIEAIVNQFASDYDGWGTEVEQ